MAQRSRQFSINDPDLEAKLAAAIAELQTPDDAQHTIRSTGSSHIPSRAEQEGGGWKIALTAMFLLFLIFINFPPGGGGSSPTPPSPPQPRAALIKSVGDSPFVLALAGATYTYNYMSKDIWRAKGSQLDKPVCIADFLSKKFTGDPVTARTIVLIGKLELQVGSMGGVSSLIADIQSRDNIVSAYFNYDRSPRAPPASDSKATPNSGRAINLVIVGEMQRIDIGTAHDQSSRDVSILELDPSRTEQKSYADAKREYEIDIANKPNHPPPPNSKGDRKMAKIAIGATHDHATSKISASLSIASQMELTVGDAYDMSDRQVEILERDGPQLDNSIKQLRSHIAEIEQLGGNVAPVATEARQIAEQAEAVVVTKKWQNISLSNLAEYAKKAGETAIPILKAATEVVAFLKSVNVI